MNKQRGFSMLEVLVSMLVIMIGALGIAGMQLLAITSTENARYQNVATMLGASLAANMQANVAYWGTPPGLINVVGGSNTGGPAAYTNSCEGLTSACSATEMAGYDLTAWGQQVAALLPGGTAQITCPANNNPAICTVKLTWLERNVSLQDVPAADSGGGGSGGSGGGGSGVGGGGSGGGGSGGGGGVGGSGGGGSGGGSPVEVSPLKSGTRQANTYQTLVSIL